MSADLSNIAKLLDPNSGSETPEVSLQELTLDNITFDWIEKTTRVPYLKKALRLIEEDGRQGCYKRKLLS
jgi:hypothetical protein